MKIVESRNMERGRTRKTRTVEVEQILNAVEHDSTVSRRRIEHNMAFLKSIVYEILK